jgi:hypothetical protein
MRWMKGGVWYRLEVSRKGPLQEAKLPVLSALPFAIEVANALPLDSSRRQRAKRTIRSIAPISFGISNLVNFDLRVI